MVTGLQSLRDVVNVPAVLRFGQDLFGSGPSLGRAIPIVDGTWAGPNSSLRVRRLVAKLNAAPEPAQLP